MKRAREKFRVISEYFGLGAKWWETKEEEQGLEVRYRLSWNCLWDREVEGADRQLVIWILGSE